MCDISFTSNRPTPFAGLTLPGNETPTCQRSASSHLHRAPKLVSAPPAYPYVSCDKVAMRAFDIQRLPLEIQEEVWSWALPAARVLWLVRARDNTWRWCASQEPVPSLMHVAARPRHVCLRFYQRLGTSAPLFIDYERDIVLMHPLGPKPTQSYILDTAHTTGLQVESVRHLGLVEAGWHVRIMQLSVSHFAKLQSLTIFMSDRIGRSFEFLDAEATEGGEAVQVIKNYLAYSHWLRSGGGSYASCYSAVWGAMDKMAVRCARPTGMLSTCSEGASGEGSRGRQQQTRRIEVRTNMDGGSSGALA